MQEAHIPVLFKEVIDSLCPRTGGRYIDGTVGAGGHAAGILEAAGPEATLLGLDADPDALAIASRLLAPYGERVRLVNENFRHLAEVAKDTGFVSVDGVLLDIGVSSMQLDVSKRGFSFRTDAPLDMRFDPRQTVSAADIVNGANEAELRKMLFEYGEERAASRIARAIVRRRSIRRVETTADLASIVEKAMGSKRSSIHPATRTFQALRIAVNRELDSLREALPQALELLAKGGRLAVISFHSLEDRIVKEFMRREASSCICPPGLPICVCGKQPTLRIVYKKPVTASPEELQRNPRARSSKLRVAEKIV